MEPDTTVCSDDIEVTMETDHTVQKFRCKQLRAELDILAQKDLKCEVLSYIIYVFQCFVDCWKGTFYLSTSYHHVSKFALWKGNMAP